MDNHLIMQGLKYFASTLSWLSYQLSQTLSQGITNPFILFVKHESLIKIYLNQINTNTPIETS